jgi:hypothetical protein
MAVQVYPIKPMLKAPGTERLKLNHEERLPNFAFKPNLRRYTVGGSEAGRAPAARHRPGGVVQVDPMKPKSKPPGTKRLKLKCDILLSTSAFKISLRRSALVHNDKRWYGKPLAPTDRAMCAPPPPP